ncbi:MAG: hypothetical protein LBK26_01020 [Rickettsiales bacterium]|jgi:hypothetical protein|nr:hypothetical protein [Rickettsiales bacterium]
MLGHRTAPLRCFFLSLILLTTAVTSGDADVAAKTYVDGIKSYCEIEIAGAEKKSNKNISNGYPGLDAQGKISPAQIPTDSYPAQNSANMVSSGAIWTEIHAAWNDYY